MAAGRRLIAALTLAAPAAAAALGLALQPPGVGQALRDMDRARARQPVLPQTFVLPERPGQNQVSWYDFDWRQLDLPSPSGGKGGLRLYYYQREKPIAERALPAIRSAWLRLVDQFHYSPTRRIPYILYSSKREFQTTNLFAVGESVLGVTSPKDLRMSLPYFGDHARFREVSTHELVHQFTIQKLLDIAGADQLAFVDDLPLWFIEGIAEYYAKGGLDPEADLYLRDLVWNPDSARHYEVLPFAEDRIRGYIPTYKLGQARVAFVADVYGKEKIQAMLENARTPGAPAGGGDRAFSALVRRVLNEEPDQVDARWRAWMRRRYFPEYLKVRHDLAQLREHGDLPAEPEAFVASGDGWLVLFRGLDREQGRARLFLFDVRWPRGAVEVARDNQPGVESLHPIDQNVLAIADGKLLFAAQDGPGDSLYLVPFEHEPPREGRPPRIRLGKRERLMIRHPGGLRFVELGDPAFSADGSQLAFVGLTELGQRDLYVVSAGGGTARQLTDDPYAERDLAWGRDGIYCASDATDHGRPNLFRIDPATGERTRLTTAPSEDRHPFPQADGSVLYSSDVGGKPDLYLLQDGASRRLSDFATGLGSPAPAPGGRGIYATTFYRGHFRLVELPRVAWLEDAPVLVAPAAAPILEIPRDPIPDFSPRYQAFHWGNWHPDAGNVSGGGGAGSVAGRAALLFSDTLGDRTVYLDFAVYGSFEFAQGLVLYEDRRDRASWVLGGYHFVNQQIDRVDPDRNFYQRDFGLLSALRFPLDRFQRLELQAEVGGVQRYCLTDFSVESPTACGGLAAGSTDDWRKANGGVNLSLGPTLRYGYDTVRLDPYTGPIDGSAVLLELGGGWLPGRQAVHGFARLDAAHWWRILGRSNLMLRAAGGGSFAPDERGLHWARAWWLTSADNLRGFFPLDTGYLVGTHYFVANAELQFPLSPVVRLFLFDYLEGVVAADFGGVANHVQNVRQFACSAGGACGEVTLPGLWASRTLTGVLGVNAVLGPVLLRVHFGHPIDIRGAPTPALADGTRWVTNLTLRWAFF
jgi:hypothetical protein